MRGIAALQVVALHYLSAFLPAIGLVQPDLARHRWEALFAKSPLFILADGYAAVYLFFLISGAALTFAFESRPFAIVPGALRRLVRLGIPMAASIALGAALFALMPNSHQTAAGLSGSQAWLGAVGPSAVTLSGILREILLSGMLAGHAELGNTLLPQQWAAGLGLVSLWKAPNPPLWSLHFELYGSFLVLALVALRAWLGRLLHQLCCAALLALLLDHPLGLFVIGHFLAPVLASLHSHPANRRGALAPLAGLAALLAAAAMASYSMPRLLVAPLLRQGAWVGLPGHLWEFPAQSMLEALLVFAAVILLAPLRRVLESRFCRWLGRISFGLYLTHFPVLFTISAGLFVWLNGHPAASLVVSLVGVPLSLLLAVLFERMVDRPAIRLSHRIGRAMRPAQHPHRPTPGDGARAAFGIDTGR